MALTANTDVRRSDIQWGGTHSYEVASAQHIYRDGAVGMDTEGNVGPLTTTTYKRFVGFASEEANNATGADSKIRVEVYDMAGEEFELSITGATLDDIGKPVYASADATFTLTQTSATVFIGYVSHYVSSTKLRVKIVPWHYEYGTVSLRMNNSATPASAVHTLSFPWTIRIITIYKGALVGVVTSTGAAIGTVQVSGALGYITSATPLSVAAATSLTLCATHCLISANTRLYAHEIGCKTAGRGPFITINYIKEQKF